MKLASVKSIYSYLFLTYIWTYTNENSLYGFQPRKAVSYITETC